MNKTSKILGGLYGLLLGDALGRPYEMRKPEDLPELPSDLLEPPPPPFEPAWPDAPAFAYTDDGARALCLLETMFAGGDHAFEPDRFADDFGRRLLHWLDDGYLAVDGHVFGTGGTTRKALARIREGTPPHHAGIDAEDALGNGGIMGALPLPLLFEGPNDKLIELAMAQCRVTHAHPLALATAASFCIWARYMRKSPNVCDLAITRFLAYEAVRNVASVHPSLKAECLKLLETLGGHRGLPTGGFYVVDTFYSAVECQAGNTFEDVIRRAIRLGNDADTTAAVAGGIAGIRFGMEKIPSHWLHALLMMLPTRAVDMFRRLARGGV